MQTNEQNPNHSERRSMLRRHGRLVAMSSAAAIVVLGLGAFALLPAAHNGLTQVDTPVRLAAASESTSRTPPRMLESSTPFSFADLVERVSPAVVSITSESTETSQSSQLPDNIPEQFRNFFNQFNNGQPPTPRRTISAGSGFIIDKSGLIVTNNHVIDGARKITVKMPGRNGRSYTAKLVGTDPLTDVALLKIDSDKPLPTVEFGDDRQLRVGDWVIAVGNPFALSNTVTAGIVSSIGRDIGDQYDDYIQIDAPINQGNSGGPTFDLRGQVVGMNSMIFSPTGGSVGIGFAIPASTIQEVVAQLQSHGKVARGWLGVEIQSVTPEIAASLGLKDARGAIVAGIVPDSPAAKAGIADGDIIMSVNGKSVQDSRDLTRQVAGIAAGSTASFGINRQGADRTIKVTIAQRQESRVASAGQPSVPEAAPAAMHAMGLGLAPVTPDARRTYNLGDDVDGVVITKVDPDSDAADKGLQPGDVVEKIGTRPVHTPQDVQNGITEAQKSGRKSVLLLVSSQGTSQFITVEIGQT